MSEIVDMIRSCVIAGESPAVYISGGLDSTIVLHHVSEKAGQSVRTYSARFGLDGDESRAAEMVAEHYGTAHTTVDISDFVPRLPEILRGFEQPRFNVWPQLLAEQAKKDGVRTVYIGEGADEHFGGYEDKSYLEAWADHLTYTIPTYRTIHEKLGLQLEAPFTRLDWRQTLKYYAPPTKAVLRQAYRGIVPAFVLDRRKARPAFTNYWQLWRLCLCKYFPKYQPASVGDIRGALNWLATRAWLETNDRFSGKNE